MSSQLLTTEARISREELSGAVQVSIWSSDPANRTYQGFHREARRVTVRPGGKPRHFYQSGGS